jgi:hypothetical protein
MKSLQPATMETHAEVASDILDIKTGGKIREYVALALEKLKSKGNVEFVAKNKAMTKAITVVEIVKRNVEGLQQETQISRCGDSDAQIRIKLSS